VKMALIGKPSPGSKTTEEFAPQPRSDKVITCMLTLCAPLIASGFFLLRVIHLLCQVGLAAAGAPDSPPTSSTALTNNPSTKLFFRSFIYSSARFVD
jgi:hypothetical protein